MTPDSPPSCTFSLVRNVALTNQFEQFRPYLLAIARREFASQLGDGCCGADLVQETFLAAFQKEQQFRGTSPDELLAWLRAILRYKIFRHRRKRRQLLQLTCADLRSTLLPTDVKAEQAEDLRRILCLLEEMPDLQQQIIDGRTTRDETFHEIGLRLGMTAEAARKSFSRAIQQLRGNFETWGTMSRATKQAER